MQKSLFLVLFVAFLTSRCSMVVFEKPIPAKATLIDKCPTSLVGQFVEQKSDSTPHLLQEVIAFESPLTHQWFVYEYSQIEQSDLKNYPNFEVKNNVLIEHIKKSQKDFATSKDSIVETPLVRTKTGYQTIKRLTYSLDFKTKTITQYPESKDTDVKIGTFDMRQKGDTYYLNIKGLENEDYWYVILLTPKSDELRINMLSQIKEEKEEEINAIMPLTKLDDDTFLAKPTDEQLEAFIKHPDTGEVTVYKRLKQ
jgi:hypothetical protein